MGAIDVGGGWSGTMQAPHSTLRPNPVLMSTPPGVPSLLPSPCFLSRSLDEPEDEAEKLIWHASKKTPVADVPAAAAAAIAAVKRGKKQSVEDHFFDRQGAAVVAIHAYGPMLTRGIPAPEEEDFETPEEYEEATRAKRGALTEEQVAKLRYVLVTPVRAAALKVTRPTTQPRRSLSRFCRAELWGAAGGWELVQGHVLCAWNEHTSAFCLPGCRSFDVVNYCPLPLPAVSLVGLPPWPAPHVALCAAQRAEHGEAGAGRAVWR